MSLPASSGSMARSCEPLCTAARWNNPFAEVPALPDRSGSATCPFCHELMDKGDYCGARIVFFDRCELCAVLWIGRGELAAMSRLWARMEERRARTKAQLAEDLAILDAIFYAHVNTP